MATPESAEPTATNNQSFRQLEQLRDPDGVLVTITENVRDGRVTFMIQREYEKGGTTKQTAFLHRRHIAAVRRVLNDLDERLELIEDQTRARRR
jgi:hypothetical protein